MRVEEGQILNNSFDSLRIFWFYFEMHGIFAGLVINYEVIKNDSKWLRGQRFCPTHHSVAKIDSDSGLWITVHGSAVEAAKFRAWVFPSAGILGDARDLLKVKNKLYTIIYKEK